jgi:hypothetical protein
VTDAPTTAIASEPASEPAPEPAPGGTRTALALGIGILVAVVAGFLVVRWLRRGGAERAVRGVAEHEAVALADAVVDRLFAA